MFLKKESTSLGSLRPNLAVIVASNWSSYLVDQRNAIDQTLHLPPPIAHTNFLRNLKSIVLKGWMEN
jgi:hypothetical protein